jgi:hypothetical protein
MLFGMVKSSLEMEKLQLEAVFVGAGEMYV